MQCIAGFEIPLQKDSVDDFQKHKDSADPAETHQREKTRRNDEFPATLGMPRVVSAAAIAKVLAPSTATTAPTMAHTIDRRPSPMPT